MEDSVLAKCSGRTQKPCRIPEEVQLAGVEELDPDVFHG